MALTDVKVKNWTRENTSVRIRALLERENLTQYELARVLTVNLSTVARWCRAGATIPDVRSRIALQRIIERRGAA